MSIDRYPGHGMGGGDADRPVAPLRRDPRVDEALHGIVVAVSASDDSGPALDWAFSESLRLGVPVAALRVWSAPVGSVGLTVGALPGSRTEARRAAADIVLRAIESARARMPGGEAVDCRPVLLEGATVPVLGQAAKDARLFVVGTRGATALRRALLGSVSGSCLHRCHGPVVVVPHGPGERLARPRRVVVATNGSARSTSAMAWARAYSLRLDVPLVTVTVDGREVGAVRGAMRAADLAARMGAGVSACEPVWGAGSVAAQLAAFATADDLLVVGGRVGSLLAGALRGSVSARLVQQARCSVAVVRQDNARLV
jgi:nucleotide-binding universal stress UspA family protein